jgi:branched-chain amino acid transport system permease protein
MKNYASYLNIFVVLVLLAVCPVFLSTYYTGLVTLMMIYAMFAMSLDIIQGYTGLPSLGHAAFWGTSGYVVAILNVKLFKGSHFGPEVLAGLFSAVLVAILFGLIVLRSREVYFLMIILASSMMLWGIAFKWRSLTGGDDGLPGVSRPDLSGMGFDLGIATHYYYFVLLFFLVSAGLMYLVVRSSFGHTLQGIRESETRMRSLGYDVWLQKYIAFIVSAVFAGFAGILMVYYDGYVNPLQLHLVTSAEALIMVILGGSGTLFGPAIGAAIIILIKNMISGYTEHWMIILGALYILTVIFAPEGVYPPLRQLLQKRGAFWNRSSS